jgi:hypothetical protein
MNITLEDQERNLILFLLDRLTIKPIDAEAVQISLAAQSLLAKVQPSAPIEAEIKEEEK